jgi:hypothetical protein
MEDLMYSRIPPVAASVIVAAVAALLFAAVTNLPLRMIHRATALNTAMFLGLAAYVGFLGRLNGTHYRDLLAPLLILSAVLVAAGSVTGFVIPAAAGLSWIRSGICFPGPIPRRAFAEAILCAAGLSLVWMLQPPGLSGWALSVWLFWLIQSLYFLVVDPEPGSLFGRPGWKRFEAAHSRTQVLLKEQKLARAFEELGL